MKIFFIHKLKDYRGEIMARGFTEREKEIIRNDLINTGRELFGTYGLKKTSIEDLTKAVGIAQGSFYTFLIPRKSFIWRLWTGKGRLLSRSF